MTGHDIPQERDLPAGRLAQLKDDLMAHIDQDIDQETEAVPGAASRGRRPRWRRAGLVAAAAAAAVGLTATFVATGDDSATASPNFAELTDDGFVRIFIEDLDDADQVERDLEAVGVSAVVDIHEGSGYSCDRSRSDGWVTEPVDGLLPEMWEDVPGDDRFDFRLDPDALRPGETLALEFFWDEHDGAWATLMSFNVSSTPVGECVLVEDPAIIVDAEAGIVGG
jgi:hypothetical protein